MSQCNQCVQCPGSLKTTEVKGGMVVASTAVQNKLKVDFSTLMFGPRGGNNRVVHATAVFSGANLNSFLIDACTFKQNTQTKKQGDTEKY